MSETKTKLDWQQRHFLSRLAPAAGYEARLVVLLDAIELSIDRHEDDGQSFPNSIASPAYGSILEGVVKLLNFDTGRLDEAAIYEECQDLATRVGWDLTESKVKWVT